MNKKYIFFIILCTYSYNCKGLSAVTYLFSGGRFGDNLLSYSHAKWISYKFKIPLLYKPFFCSDSLAMHKNELLYKNEIKKYKQTIIVDLNKKMQINPKANILYVIPYYPISYDEYSHSNFKVLTEWNPDWNDEGFISELKKNIFPLIKLPSPIIPKNYISVAVHIRTMYNKSKKDSWGKYKTQTNENKCSESRNLRYLTNEYFIEQIKEISNMYNNLPLYICIFTDHPEANKFFDIYKQNITNKNIILDFRNHSNFQSHLTILEDFFALTKFDCIIKPYSNFSAMASKLTKYKIEINPCHFKIIDNQIKYFAKIKDRRI